MAPTTSPPVSNKNIVDLTADPANAVPEIMHPSAVDSGTAFLPASDGHLQAGQIAVDTIPPSTTSPSGRKSNMAAKRSISTAGAHDVGVAGGDAAHEGFAQAREALVLQAVGEMQRISQPSPKPKPKSHTNRTKLEAEVASHTQKLRKVYGVSIYNMMPKGYRYPSEHIHPSKAFVYTLGALTNIAGKEHPSLSEVQMALIGGCDRRRVGTIDAKKNRYIMLTDVEYAYKLRKSVMQGIEKLVDESDKDACRKEHEQFKEIEYPKQPGGAVNKPYKFAPGESELMKHAPKTAKAAVSTEVFEGVDANGFVPKKDRLGREVWLEKFIVLALNNLELMVTDRTRAVTELTTALYHLRHGYTADTTQLRNCLKQGSASLMDLVLNARNGIETTLKAQGLLSADVHVSQREQRNLLAHINDEDFGDVITKLDIRWVAQLMLTSSEAAAAEGLPLSMAGGV